MYVMNASGSASTTSPPVASKLLVLEARVDRLFQQFDNLRQLLAGTASPPEAFAAEIPTYLPVTTNAMLKDINPNDTMRLEENLDGHPGRQGTHNEVLRLAREVIFRAARAKPPWMTARTKTKDEKFPGW
ncbi:hypothetical protein F441_09204 [Phytophthora nicotianae CJ01A1]|nr:hypothetical protein F441_09204 [Phytophthora nicotianae CJ01A1]